MARPGYSLATKGGGGSVKSLILTLQDFRAAAAFAAGTMKIIMPETGKVIGIGLNLAALGGTHSTSTLDVLKASTSLLTAVFDVAAVTPGTPVQKEGSALAAAADVVAKDAVLSITLAESGGSSPLWRAATLQIDYVPLGD